jgi:hypothetical protein
MFQCSMFLEGGGGFCDVFGESCVQRPRFFASTRKKRKKRVPPKNRGTNGTNGTFLCNQRLTLFFSVPTLSTLGTKTTDLTTKSIHAIFCLADKPGKTEN